MALVTVLKVQDIPDGGMIAVEAEGKKLLVVSFEGGFYAIDAKCSHMGGDLTKGKLTNGVVKCPRHGAEYDVKTGLLVKDVGGMAKAINLGRGATGQTSYKVVVEGGDVKVEI
ncbi:Rieske (2Fe-2S) protein [Chloroflexota bacterium]